MSVLTQQKIASMAKRLRNWDISDSDKEVIADMLEQLAVDNAPYNPMTDKDKIAQMEDLNWKPAAQYWKDKAEKLQKELTSTALDYLAADMQAAENYNRMLDAEEKLNEAMVALEKVQAFVRDLEPYADQGHTLVPSLQYACEVYNKLKGQD